MLNGNLKQLQIIGKIFSISFFFFFFLNDKYVATCVVLYTRAGRK